MCVYLLLISCNCADFHHHGICSVLIPDTIKGYWLLQLAVLLFSSDHDDTDEAEHERNMEMTLHALEYASGDDDVSSVMTSSCFTHPAGCVLYYSRV